MLIQEQIKKTVVPFGNGSIVYTPKKWIGEEVIITLPKLSLKEEIFKILDLYLEHIAGIYLYGSYARNENEPDSDIDILVISDKKFKIKKEGYDILTVTLERAKRLIKEEPLFYYSIIKEARPILNNALLLDLKNTRLEKKNFKWFIETTRDHIKTNEELIKLDKLDGKYIESHSVIYSLILRLRGVMLIECLIKNRTFSNKAFKNWMLKYISNYEFNNIYNVYRAIRDNKKIKDIKIEIRSIEKLLSLLEKEIKRFRW